MVGLALVCFGTDTTLISSRGEASFQRISRMFLACQMPDCQVALLFSHEVCAP
jgi:hypothetical protein